MGKKSGPPYDVSKLDSKYLVLSDPFGVPRGSSASARAANVVSAWLKRMFKNPKLDVDQVLFMRTRAYVIVKLPLNTDLSSVLGGHFWQQFLLHVDNRDRDRVSHVYEYNYRMNGDPENHNWEPEYPDGKEPPQSFPVKVDYPRPTRLPPPPSLTNVVLPLPAELPPPPPETVSSTIKTENSALSMSGLVTKHESQDGASTFRPYESPAHLPQSLSPMVSQMDRKSTVPSKKHKFDPYDEEEQAARLLRESPQEQTPAPPIKPEPSTEAGDRRHVRPDVETSRQGPPHEAHIKAGIAQIVKTEQRPSLTDSLDVKREVHPELAAAFAALEQSYPSSSTDTSQGGCVKSGHEAGGMQEFVKTESSADIKPDLFNSRPTNPDDSRQVHPDLADAFALFMQSQQTEPPMHKANSANNISSVKQEPQLIPLNNPSSRSENTMRDSGLNVPGKRQSAKVENDLDDRKVRQRLR